MTDVKDFQVRITVKNNRILAAMRNCGIKTISELAKLSSTANTVVGNLILFKASPLAHGDWKNVAFNVSSALHCEPEDLWPDHIKLIKSNKTAVILELDSDEVQRLSAPSKMKIDSRGIEKLLRKLPKESRELLDGFIANEKLETLGKKAWNGGQDVSRERTRQKIQKILRTLRSPHMMRGKSIDDFIEEAPID